MGLSARLLGADEQVVVHLRTHGSAVVLPAVVVVAVSAAAGVGAAMVPEDYRPAGQVLLAAVAATFGWWWGVLPFLRWLTTTYTVTTRRLILRSGIVTKTGRDLPLIRIHDLAFERSLVDRALGRGSLRVKTAAHAVVELRDVPGVVRVHAVLSELLFGDAPRLGGDSDAPRVDTPQRDGPVNTNFR